MTGIVLAGGRSRRMGKDKAELPWKSGTLLTEAVDKLRLFCKEVIVVGPQRPLEREVRWTQDRYVGKGPLAGLHAGLEEASFDSALILPCDMPTLPVRVLEEMVLVANSKKFDVVLPVHSEGNEPLCTWLSKEACLPVIRRLLEDGYTCPLDIFPQVRVGYLEVERFFPQATMEKIFANLNSPADYEIAKQEKTAQD
ncbi:MAG: molybdenum cofactor guanylyltransferase [Firmicutes bacterium]|nr:molybdenum cofactor guanylyltransferase [Bacillota bacterium]